jgi:hypothetical protein
MPRSRRAGPDRRFGAVLSLYLFGLAGCDGERLTVHPLPELLIRPGAPAAVIESSAGAVPPAAAFVVELREGDNTISIGVLDEPSPLQFGSVAGAEFGPGGTLLVLDGQASDLRVFSLGAGPPEVIAAGVQIVGGAGTGPGEFQRPTALSVGRAGLLGVFESTGRVHLFGWNEEGALEHRTTFQLRMDVEDGCVLGDHLVTTGLHSEHSGAVHLFSTSGEWVRSFGRFYDTDNPWVSETIHRSLVTCLEGSNEILVAPLFLPEARKYDALGNLLWWTEFDGLRPVYLAETVDGMVGVGTPEDGYHGTIGVTGDVGGGVAILQVGLVTRERRERGSDQEISTYVLALDTGEGALLGRDIRRIRDIDAAGAVLSSGLPFPTLRVIPWPSDVSQR